MLLGQEVVTCEIVLDTLTNETVYKNPEKLPEPKKGKNSWMKELAKQIKVETTVDIGGYPHEKLIVGFIVCADGQVVGERVLMDSPLKDLEKQILSVIKNTKWTSGFCNTQAVNVLMEYPILIRIAE
tara:strand:- start:1470 stop:1850 length:381 start_codon:yes stop_codon:yes gene_type:complete